MGILWLVLNEATLSVFFDRWHGQCPKCHMILPEYISRRRGRREGRIEKWAKQGKRFKAADFQPLKNEARKTAAKAAGSKAIVGCFMVYLDSSGAVSSESFITEPGLEVRWHAR